METVGLGWPLLADPRRLSRFQGWHGVDTGPQSHQDQDVRQYNVVTLRAVGLVRLEMEAAVLHEGHSVVVVEGDVDFLSELPVRRH